MPLNIVRQDIVKMQVDAIVNAANNRLQAGGGVCGAIFHAAGEAELQQECNKIGFCPTGSAVITGGYKLPAKYVIHAVGPVWQGGGQNEEKQLYGCYGASLKLAKEKKLQSIAFPLISSGIYGYPKAQALQVATRAITDFLVDNDMVVYLIVFDKSAVQIGDKLYSSIKKYIDDNYEPKVTKSRSAANYRAQEVLMMDMCQPVSRTIKEPQVVPQSLENLIGRLDESFSQTLLRLIDATGKKDSDIYKKANIDRKLFSKIRNDKNYRPKKITVIAFAIALELNIDETRDLLQRAGFALSHCDKFDVIIEYFIMKGNYNIYEINRVLYLLDQKCLGA